MCEVSEKTGIPITTIRHWEKAGLLRIPRREGNWYRFFDHLLYNELDTADISICNEEIGWSEMDHPIFFVRVPNVIHIRQWLH
ncbi:MerR family DNA-binding transcriptional regulator [Paenibacillus sp. V4I7]|uniref:MerR family transcriptional regulator n=1 Tax=Paenibacillus sp. V4I7 TaxID=3042307 RepID=UPI003593F889